MTLKKGCSLLENNQFFLLFLPPNKIFIVDTDFQGGEAQVLTSPKCISSLVKFILSKFHCTNIWRLLKQAEIFTISIKLT